MDGIDRLHGIAEDVGRTVWLRDLGAALSDIADGIEGGTRDPSGYESEVLAWVEKNGGLDAVKERTMPEDMSWPFYEDGEPVRLGEHWQQDGYDWSITSIDSIEFAEDGVRFGNEYADAFYRYGERVKRPAPPVLDADGVEIREGDTVYHVKDGSEMTVCGIEGEWLVVSVGGRVRHDIVTHRAPVLAADGKPLEVGQTVYHTDTGREYQIHSINDDGKGAFVYNNSFGQDAAGLHLCPVGNLTHQRPVLDADGVPIKKGDTVWLVDQPDSDWKFTVANVLAPNEHSDGKWSVKIKSDWGVFTYREPSQLTHTKPEPDSWSSVWADVSNGNETPEGMMRRCRALAERGE